MTAAIGSAGYPDSPRVLALLLARNEMWHVPYAIRDLAAAGADIALIDNDSTDGTPELARAAASDALVTVERVPFTGAFDLAAVIVRVHEVAAHSGYDWALLAAADEWPQSDQPGQGLPDVAADADDNGATVIDFDEFVFLPSPDDDMRGGDYRRELLRYYYFAPSQPRLMRMWSLDAEISLGAGDGHTLSGDVRLSPRRPALRHYPVLGHAHAMEKYLSRRYPPAALARGWHVGRAHLTAEALRPRGGHCLRELPTWASVAFDRSAPSRWHFWEPQWQ